MKSRPPLHGYNTNYRRDGTVYHVQTEDLGSPASAVVTQVFSGGTVLAMRRTPYIEFLDEEDGESRVRELMRKQHKAMLVALRDGNLQGADEEGDAEQVMELEEGDFDIVDDGASLRDTMRMDRPPNFAESLVAEGRAREKARAEAGARAAEAPPAVEPPKEEPAPVAEPPRPPAQAEQPRISHREEPSRPPSISPKRTLPLFAATGKAGPQPEPATSRRAPSQRPEQKAEEGRPSAPESDAKSTRAPRIFSEVSRPPAGVGADQLGERSLDEVILSYLAEDLQDE